MTDFKDPAARLRAWLALVVLDVGIPTDLRYDDAPLEQELYGTGGQGGTPANLFACPAALPDEMAAVRRGVAAALTVLPELPMALAPVFQERAPAGDVAEAISLGITTALECERHGLRTEACRLWTALAELERAVAGEGAAAANLGGLGADQRLDTHAATLFIRHARQCWEAHGGAVLALVAAADLLVLAALDPSATAAPQAAAGESGCLSAGGDGLLRLAAGLTGAAVQPARWQLFERALGCAMAVALTGPDHPYQGHLFNLLMRSCQDADDEQAAVPFGRQALAVLERSLGAEHRAVAECMSNLASSLVNLGELDEAEGLLQRAASIAPSFPHSYRWLALVYQRRGRDGDAERELAAWRRYLAVGPPPFRLEEAQARVAVLSAPS